MKKCAREGCSGKVIKSRVFCDECKTTPRVCVIEGCGNAIGMHNRSGFCYDHRWMMIKVKWLKDAGLLALMLLLGGGVARAEEAGGAAVVAPVLAATPSPDLHCHREAIGVVCPPEGFDRLVGRCVDFRRDRDICLGDLSAARDEVGGLKKALTLSADALIACQAVPKASSIEWKAPVAFALGVVGGGMVAVALVGSGSNWGERLGVGSVGALLLGSGVWVAAW